nr:uncharacterized protein LOC125420409 [Ziziphus jujuba var. spinosa]
MKTSRRFWISIGETYASHSEVTMIQLRNELQTTKKGAMKVIEYCKKMKKIAHQLFAGGFLVSEKELVICILIGLGPEYETIRVSYTSSLPSPSLQEVNNYLAHYETTLEQNSVSGYVHIFKSCFCFKSSTATKF